MIEYPIEKLSPRDFEKICIDLIHAEYGLLFESFPEGPDSGIDGIIIDAGKKIILQCKRYKDFSNLKRELRSECEKMVELQPSEYYLLTSCKITIRRLSLS